MLYHRCIYPTVHSRLHLSVSSLGPTLQFPSSILRPAISGRSTQSAVPPSFISRGLPSPPARPYTAAGGRALRQIVRRHCAVPRSVIYPAPVPPPPPLPTPPPPPPPPISLHRTTPHDPTVDRRPLTPAPLPLDRPPTPRPPLPTPFHPTAVTSTGDLRPLVRRPPTSDL